MIDKLADALPLWCSQLACLSVGLLIFFVATGLLSQIGDEARRTIRPRMTDAEAAAEYQRLYIQDYDGDMHGTMAKMERIVAEQGWDRAGGMPGERPIIRGAVGQNNLTNIRLRAGDGLGPNDGGNPKYNPKAE